MRTQWQGWCQIRFQCCTSLKRRKRRINSSSPYEASLDLELKLHNQWVEEKLKKMATELNDGMIWRTLKFGVLLLLYFKANHESSVHMRTPFRSLASFRFVETLGHDLRWICTWCSWRSRSHGSRRCCGALPEWGQCYSNHRGLWIEFWAIAIWLFW